MVNNRIIRFKVPNIVCGGCAQTIKYLLTENDKTLNVYVNWPKKEVSVIVPKDRLEDDAALMLKFKEKLAEAGFTLEPTKTIKSYIIKGVLGLVAGFAMLTLMAFGSAIPLFVMAIVGALSVALTLYLGHQTYQSAFTKLIKAKSLTMDALFTVSTLFAIGISIAAFFVPWLPMLFDAALLIFGFRHIGIAIEETIKRKVVQGVAFRDRVPKEVQLENDGQSTLIQTSKLKPGDIIRVKAGEYIPVDGECLDEESSVHATILNGRGHPRFIRRGDALRAGYRVAVGVDSILIKVKKSEEDSYLAQIDNRIDEAQNTGSPIESHAERILRYFVPIVFIIAAISGIIIGCLFPPAIAVQCVVSTLVSACPCTLGFIVPLAVNIGINKAREHGVEFKSGSGLEAASKVDTVMMDLNGTLTVGEPVVTGIHPISENINDADALKYLALLEEGASHSIGKEIYQAACKHATIVPDKKNHEIIFDEKKYQSGVRAKIDGETYTIGNLTMMDQHGIVIDEKILPAKDEAEQLVFMARGKELVAVVRLADPLREDALSVVRELQKTKRVCICTGADTQTALSYARRLGISENNVFAQCVPINDEDESSTEKLRTKTEVLNTLHNKEKNNVAFVGDAGNDSLVMSHCCGIAVRSPCGDIVTEDKAQAVIEGDSLKPILAVFSVAKQTIKNIKQSLGMSLAYNIVALLIAGGLLVAIGFVLNPGIGVALMVAQTCLILAIAYYYKRKSPFQNEQKTTPESNAKTCSTALHVQRELRKEQSFVTSISLKQPEVEVTEIQDHKNKISPSDPHISLDFTGDKSTISPAFS